MSQWINCNEKMPEVDENGCSETVLVVGHRKMILQNFIYKYEWRMPMEVTHWMPLPELPEEYL